MARKTERMEAEKALRIAIDVVQGKRRPMRYWVFDAKLGMAQKKPSGFQQKALEAYNELEQVCDALDALPATLAELREKVERLQDLATRMKFDG